MGNTGFAYMTPGQINRFAVFFEGFKAPIDVLNHNFLIHGKIAQGLNHRLAVDTEDFTALGDQRLVGEVYMTLIRQLVEDVKDTGFNPQFGIIFKTQFAGNLVSG